MIKKKNQWKQHCESRILYPAKLSFKKKKKDFPKQKMKKFIITGSDLYEMLKGVL